MSKTDSSITITIKNGTKTNKMIVSGSNEIKIDMEKYTINGFRWFQ